MLQIFNKRIIPSFLLFAEFELNMSIWSIKHFQVIIMKLK